MQLKVYIDHSMCDWYPLQWSANAPSECMLNKWQSVPWVCMHSRVHESKHAPTTVLTNFLTSTMGRRNHLIPRRRSLATLCNIQPKSIFGLYVASSPLACLIAMVNRPTVLQQVKQVTLALLTVTATLHFPLSEHFICPSVGLSYAIMQQYSIQHQHIALRSVLSLAWICADARLLLQAGSQELCFPLPSDTGSV